MFSRQSRHSISDFCDMGWINLSFDPFIWHPLCPKIILEDLLPSRKLHGSHSPWRHGLLGGRLGGRLGGWLHGHLRSRSHAQPKFSIQYTCNLVYYLLHTKFSIRIAASIIRSIESIKAVAAEIMVCVCTHTPHTVHLTVPVHECRILHDAFQNLSRKSSKIWSRSYPQLL